MEPSINDGGLSFVEWLDEYAIKKKEANIWNKCPLHLIFL